jgi:hypothetical protein
MAFPSTRNVKLISFNYEQSQKMASINGAISVGYTAPSDGITTSNFGNKKGRV